MGIAAKHRPAAKAKFRVIQPRIKAAKGKASYVVRADDDTGFQMIKEIVSRYRSAQITHESPTRHALAITISPSSRLLAAFRDQGLTVRRETAYAPEDAPKV